MMTLCRGGRDGAPSAIPIPRPFSGVFLPLVRGRLLRLICQNFGQISSLSSATREPRQRNKSPYAWKSCNRTNLGQVTGQWKFSNWEVPNSSRLICSFLVDKRQWMQKGSDFGTLSRSGPMSKKSPEKGPICLSSPEVY